ncbi:MAG: glycosyl hydrolase family 43 [Verrucomicrobiales bacterium]|nr:glycosyl hydrolase family 43 [Verrucomicrobiales bacterium]
MTRREFLGRMGPGGTALFALGSGGCAKTGRTGGTTAPAPMFEDPNYHGSCDPEAIWNPHAAEWWVFYTARRATRTSGTYVGTPIGVAASKDLRSWRFLGYCTLNGIPGQPDMPDTHWAPGIVRDGDAFHLFATYKDNATPPWGGPGVIRHYTAPVDDLLAGWRLVGLAAFAQPDPIDASLIRIDVGFRAYYRVGGNGGIHWATSHDLVQWTNRGPCPGDVKAPAADRGFGYQEAPYVFRFHGAWWMLTDPHQGLAVYGSGDAMTWKLQGLILKEPGRRPLDGTRARHPSVAVVGDRAFLFYHVEPWRPYPTPPAEQRTVEQKRSFLQMAELRMEQGKLVCDRDAPLFLP